MKYKINKAEFEALPEALQGEYNLDGEEATLKLEGGPDVESVEKKRQIEAEHRKNAEAKLLEAEQREAKLKKDLMNAGGDADKIKAIEAKHQSEIDKLRAEREAETQKIKDERNAGMVSEVANSFANERFTIPALIADQVRKRLSVEEVDGQPVVRVVDANGNPSTASLDDLKKEFLDNKDFSPIIKANAGSGGGATGSSGGGATSKKLSEMSISEQVQFEKNDPEGFAAAIA